MSVFVAPFGHYQFTVMPFVMVNLGASLVIMKMAANFSLQLSSQTQFAKIKN